MRGHVLLALALSGCNTVIGADEPIVADPSQSESRDGGDGDPADAPGAETIRCGDGVIEWQEECDDGNDVAGDGCHECRVECGPAPEFRGPDLQCYRSAGMAESWDAARAACEAWGGTLAALSGAEELATVQSRITATHWVGARRDPSTGELYWLNGEHYEGEGIVGDGDCVAIDGSTLMLARLSCAESFAFVCERDPAGTARR